MSQYPAAPKVQAAGISAAVSGAALYLLQTYVFKGNVPDGIASLVYVAVPGVLAYAAGWLAPHQSRPIVTVTAPVLPSNVRVQPDLVEQFADPALTGTERDPVQPAGYPPQAGKPGESARPGPLPVLPDSAYAPGAVPLERLATPGDPEPPKPGM